LKPKKISSFPVSSAHIEKIREQVTASQGKDFEKVAAEVSDCPSKAKGGKLGILSRGQAVKPFGDAAFNQKVGEVGPVVETQFGYHVIEVIDHMDASKAPLSEVKEKIAQR
jgi:peptidyl-prolyl cis-trans isomerase C